MEQTIDYKGYKIRIVRDDYSESPNEWGNDDVFLVYDHRQFTVKRDGFDPEDIYDYLIIKESLLKENTFQPKDELEDNLKGYFDYDSKYWIFPVEAYIHSGVSLSLFYSTKQDRWDSSVSGFVLVSKENELMQGIEFVTESMAEERAEALLETWNQYLSGEVYGYIVEKPKIIYSITKDKFDRLVFENDLATLESEFEIDHDWEEVGSCWGYYGDPEYSGLLAEAKAVIDNSTKND